jgi:hypothetical protein
VDEETARAIIPKLEALRAFVRNLGMAGQYLPDNTTRANYRAMYDDIASTINDPLLEIYAPPLPHLGTTGSDSKLWGSHQIRILESATRLISYVEAQLQQVPSISRIKALPLRCFLSFRFIDQGRAYADEVRHFLELSGIEVVTGERFEPRSVSEKLNELLDSELDFGVLIVTEDGESFWTRDEANRLWNEGKYVILLVHEDATFAQGLRGDLEWIPFSEGHISDAFSKLLEGIDFIRKNPPK